MSNLSSYLLLFSDSVGNGSQVQDFIDRKSEIVNWIRFSAQFPNAIFLVSELNAEQITDLIHSEFAAGSFIVIKLTRSQKNGYLVQSLWDFINEPSPSKEKAK